MLGYTPQSTTGAKANVIITVTPTDSPASVTIDKFTQFTSSVNGKYSPNASDSFFLKTVTEN